LDPAKLPAAVSPVSVDTSDACRPGAGAWGSGTWRTTGATAVDVPVVGMAGGAATVVPTAAAPTRAVAAMPVTRDLTITAVLSMSPTRV